jgi:AcrR family transcriptional regulator
MTASEMSSRQGRAYRQDEIEVLLRAALAEAMRDGAAFRNVTVERLCVAAGIARSTFYLYFADKPALLRALSAGAMLRLYGTQRDWLDKGEAATRADIRAAMRALFAMYRSDEAVMRAVAEAAVYEPSLRAQYHDGVNDYVGAVERFIKAGQQQGWVRELQPGPTATSLVWMVERTCTQVGRSASAHRVRTTTDALTDIIWNTLRT